MRWQCSVITARRPKSTLIATLTSLVAAGFPDAWLLPDFGADLPEAGEFSEMPRIIPTRKDGGQATMGAYGNTLRTLRTSLTQNPYARIRSIVGKKIFLNINLSVVRFRIEHSYYHPLDVLASICSYTPNYCTDYCL